MTAKLIEIPGRVVFVELTETLVPLDPIIDGVTARQLMVVGMIAMTPIAIRMVAAEGRMVSAAHLRSLFQVTDEEITRRASGTTERRDRVEATSPASVSVVVCTRDRPDDLVRCLASLQELSYPDTQIVVVDNAPTDHATWDVVQRCTGPHPVVYVREDAPGLSNARNTGLGVATGEIVAWVDDDEIVDEPWATELVATYAEHPDVAAVYGLRLPAELKTAAQWQFESRFVGIVDRDPVPQEFSSETIHPLAPALGWSSMSFRRAVVSHYGFDAALGAGTLTAGGEDLKISAQLLADGRVLRKAPGAVSHHFHREDDEALARQMFGYGTGLTAYLLAILMWRPSLLLSLPRLFARAVRSLSRSAEGQVPRDTEDDFPRQLVTTHRRGLVAGPWRYLRSRARVRRSTSSPHLEDPR